MEKIETNFKFLLSDCFDVTSRSDTLQEKLDDLLYIVRAKENTFQNTVIEMKNEYDSIFNVARVQAEKIVTDAHNAAAEEMKNATAAQQALLERTSAEAAAILATAKQERAAWEEEKALVADIQKFKPVVKVNVGGTKFTTSRTTLCRFPDTMIGAMYSGRHELVQDDEGFHFIDRDGTHFRYILNFLRAPENFKCELTGTALAELKSECEYYGLKGLMFPFTPIAPFTARNAQNIEVTVMQDYEGEFTINGIPVRICAHCGVGDYASVGNNSGEYYHFVHQFAQIVARKNGGIFKYRPRDMYPCRVCRQC